MPVPPVVFCYIRWSVTSRGCVLSVGMAPASFFSTRGWILSNFLLLLFFPLFLSPSFPSPELRGCSRNQDGGDIGTREAIHLVLNGLWLGHEQAYDLGAISCVLNHLWGMLDKPNAIVLYPVFPVVRMRLRALYETAGGPRRLSHTALRHSLATRLDSQYPTPNIHGLSQAGKADRPVPMIEM